MPNYFTNENQYNYLCYFEENSKNFFYIDLNLLSRENKTQNFTKILLKIPFKNSFKA